MPRLVPCLLLLGLGCTRHGLTIAPRDTGEPAPDSEPRRDSDPPVEGEACEPVATVAQPFGLEGEAIEASFDCGGAGVRSDFDASVAGLPEGASFDERSWRVTWTPGPDQGGRYDLALSVRPAADPATFPESAVATLWIADNAGDPANVPPDPEGYTEEWGLPVFHLAPSRPVGQEHVPADITVYGHTYHAEMKIRGAASAGYPKPSYTLRFSDEDLDASPWGMGNKDHLYAITAFDDNSYVRQKLCYDLWLAIAEHWEADRLTPRTFFGVAYLNGTYVGLYTFSDRPDDHFAQEMGLSGEGNLYKAVSHYANFYRTYGGYPKSTLHDGYEKKEGEPLEGQPGAWDDLDALVAWSADASHETFWQEHPQWLRLDEFMDWLIFVQWTSADDSAGKNSYLYNDPEAFEFRYCPWDFNHSYGQGWYTYRVSSESFNDYRSTNGIFDHLQAHAAASEELWDRYHELQDEGPLNATWMVETIDAYFGTIQASAERDWERWGGAYQSSWSSYNPNDFEREKAYLIEWIEERDAFMRRMHP
jgi:spore coat protein H